MTEVYKVIGAPGTGKTTRVVGNPELDDHQSLVQQNMDRYSMEEQAIVTYTRAGVDEAQERLAEVTNVNKYVIEDRVLTIHAYCYRAMNVDQDQVVRWFHKQNFCKKMDLEYGNENDDGDIMSSESDEGHAFFQIYGWLKSNMLEYEQYTECPAEFPSDRDFVTLAEAWDNFKDSGGSNHQVSQLLQFDDMIEGVVERGVEMLHESGHPNIFGDQPEDPMDTFKQTHEKERIDKENWRGKGPFMDTKVLYVDEVQDLTPLQWAWYLMQKMVCEEVYIGGDDDQCLPPNAPVEVKGSPMDMENRGKEFQKPIKDVNVGDFVRTLTSDGEYSYKRVSHVEKKKVNEKTFRTIRTESGNLTAVTDNHKMIARVPDAEYETQVDKHYVYLMRDNEGMWRIGETDNLRQRLNVERGARCIVPVASFDTKEKALEKETEWSLNYSIPQLTIEQRDGEVLSDPDVRERLYGNVNPQYDLIERDLGVFLDSPPLYKKSTTRGQTQSVNINIKKCADMRGDEPRHSFNVQTSDEDIKETLREFSELSEGESGGGSTRFRTTSTNYSELGDLAEEVSDTTGGDIITVMSPTEERSTATITPAGNLAEGMLVPVATGGEVEWEEIVEINDRTETTEVYDLTVPGTHTFTSSGIGVSNTIYGWAGANPNFMLDEEGDFEVLDKTYRIPAEIWETCDGVIRQVEKRQEKEVEPHGDGGEVHKYSNPLVSQVMDHLEDGECMALFRANYQVDDFREKLHEHGIPYDNMSTWDTWTDDVIKLRDGLAKLKKGEEKLTGEEVDALIEYGKKECGKCRGEGCHSCDGSGQKSMLADNNDFSAKESAMGNLGGVEPERVREIFDLSTQYSDTPMNVSNYLSQSDELGYYKTEAVRGSIENGTEDLYPERLRIGTIHSSKGKEAETVLVALDSTQQILMNMAEDTKDVPGKFISDAERRVYYVGMTRASEELVLVQGLLDSDNTIMLEDLLADHSDDSDGWAVEGEAPQAADTGATR